MCFGHEPLVEHVFASREHEFEFWTFRANQSEGVEQSVEIFMRVCVADVEEVGGGVVKWSSGGVL